jgi:hypothetical protein
VCRSSVFHQRERAAIRSSGFGSTGKKSALDGSKDGHETSDDLAALETFESGADIVEADALDQRGDLAFGDKG